MLLSINLPHSNTWSVSDNLHKLSGSTRDTKLEPSSGVFKWLKVRVWARRESGSL